LENKLGTQETPWEHEDWEQERKTKNPSPPLAA